MKSITLAAAAAVVLGSSLPALAQTTVIRGDDQTVFKKVTKIDICVLEPINGEIQKPEMEWIQAAPRAGGFRSLISLRKNFTPELSKSIERL